MRNEPSASRRDAGVGGEVTRGTREERNRTEGELRGRKRSFTWFISLPSIPHPSPPEPEAKGRRRDGG